MIMANINNTPVFSTAKITSVALFLVYTWVMLYGWLALVHAIAEKVRFTIVASPFTYASIVLTSLLLLFQKKPGALRELNIITLMLMLTFTYLVIIFHVLLSLPLDIFDVTFYYECFLIVNLGISPLYLLFRLL
ncbi:transporter [Enterobacter sp. 10-1]|nr:transporter [Enterobacter sp. 10-1]